jgi:hypothetical protein
VQTPCLLDLLTLVAGSAQRPVPGERAGDLGDGARERERRNQVLARCIVGEDVELGVAGADVLNVVEIDVQETLHEPERDEHRGERVGDDAVPPVVEACAIQGVPGV